MATMIFICSTCRASVFMMRLAGYPMMAPMTTHMMKLTMKPASEGNVSRGLRARKGIIDENLVPSGKRTALSVLPEDRGGNTSGYAWKAQRYLPSTWQLFLSRYASCWASTGRCGRSRYGAR